MKKNKNLKLIRAWFSFLARYTRKKKSLWCMAAILLVIGIAAAQNADRHEIIRIGLYCADPDEMTEAVLTNLETLDDGLYRFYRSSSLDYMQEDINLRKAECGYEFPNDLESQMQAGEDGCISVYTSPSTVLTAVVNEAVYNAIFQEYAKTMLADFIASYDVVSVKTADELKALVDENYAYEKENTPVFHVVYEDIPENFYDDQALFQIPALFLSVFGLLALIIGSVAPVNVTLIAELALLIVFSALCSILCTLLGQIIKSSLAFDALIPVILLFCLLYSPVLMDLRDFIPGYKVLSWLAPTKWYFALHNFIL